MPLAQALLLSLILQLTPFPLSPPSLIPLLIPQQTGPNAENKQTNQMSEAATQSLRADSHSNSRRIEQNGSNIYIWFLVIRGTKNYKIWTEIEQNQLKLTIFNICLSLLNLFLGLLPLGTENKKHFSLR